MRARRRGAVLLLLAVACGGVAASDVRQRERALEARVGPAVPVVVARSDLRAGTRLRPSRLAVRRVPARFAPPDALAGAAEAAGGRLAVPLAAGAYLTTAALERPDAAGSPGAPGTGERAVDVAVAAGTDLAAAGLGARVDVLITTDASEGRGRSYLALEDVELLGARAADAATGNPATEGAAAHATAIATLRVTLREAVLLTAAQSFAREIRLLLRPVSERRSRTPVVVGSDEL